MGGPDTSRGINFQYACAISIIIEFLYNPIWNEIQFEGDEDIEDISIFNANGQIIERIQVKQKRDPNQWKPSEFMKVILNFSKLDDTNGPKYRFIYSGSEGRDFYNKLKPILLKIQFETWEKLNQEDLDQLSKYLNKEAIQFLERTQQRFIIENHDSWESKKIKDLEAIRKLINEKNSLQHFGDYDVEIYNRLFNTIAIKSEGKSKYFRGLTKEEIFSLFKITEKPVAQLKLNYLEYISWVKEIASKWMYSKPLSIQEEFTYPDILSFVINVRSESKISPNQTEIPLLNVIENFSQIVIFGDSGSGKTVSLWQIALNACNSFDENKTAKIPVYLDLSGYDGEQINDLIQSSLLSSGQQISAQLIKQLITDGQIILLLDDYDYAKSNLKQDLQIRLKSWCKVNNKCPVVVVTHRPSDGYALALPTFRLLSLNYNQIRQIMENISGLNAKDISKIQNSLPNDSMHLLKNPLTLQMLTYVYLNSDQVILKSRGPLYQSVVEGILAFGEGKGFSEFERNDKTKILSLIANWMQENEIYSIPPSKISDLLGDWSENNDLVSPIYLRRLDHSKLRKELLNCGLFRIKLNGNVEFIHPTFRSFLAIQKINKQQMAHYVNSENWHTSLILWASYVDIEESNSVFEHLVENPQLLGKILFERTEKRTGVNIDSSNGNEYFQHFKDYFLNIIRKFPILLRFPPWNNLLQSGLKLYVHKSNSDDYTIHFRSSENRDSNVQFIHWDKLRKLQKGDNETIPLNFHLLPQATLEKYHPLELSYLWIMRALYDILSFFGQEGGIDLIKSNQNFKSHPEIALIMNRFLVFHELANGLPAEIQNQLPFYATQPFSIVIEIYEFLRPKKIRYAVIESERPNTISVTHKIFSNPDEEGTLIKMWEDSSGEVVIGEKKYIAALIEEATMGDVYQQSPGAVAQTWLIESLKENLIGFPPEIW